jgi:chromosome segregation ATPase
MGEELEKWYKDFLERVIEKIRKGQELTNSETQIVANYMANTQLRDHVVYLVNKLTELNANLERRLMDRLVEVERNLRDEIRKTREELLANDEKIRQELLKRIEGLEVKISASDMKIQEVDSKVEATRNDLHNTKADLERKIQEVDSKVEATRNDLHNTKADLERKIQEVDSKVEATRSDLGLVAEEVYISNFINRLVRENQAILNIYRKYETEHGEVDAIVETNEKIYVLEVKMRAEPKDVDVLLLKTKAILQERQDKGVIPVLTGSKINRIVRNYAKGLNVMIS